MPTSSATPGSILTQDPGKPKMVAPHDDYQVAEFSCKATVGAFDEIALLDSIREWLREEEAKGEGTCAPILFNISFIRFEEEPEPTPCPAMLEAIVTYCA